MTTAECERCGTACPEAPDGLCLSCRGRRPTQAEALKEAEALLAYWTAEYAAGRDPLG